jgi:hypothetical protein
MATFKRINIPRYLMHHLSWAIKEGINKGRKQVPCGRLLSEIFHQGGLLEILRKIKPASDSCFKVTTSDKIINSKTLYAMRIIKNLPVNENWMEKTTAESEPAKNFPSILQENNPEVFSFKVEVQYERRPLFCHHYYQRTRMIEGNKLLLLIQLPLNHFGITMMWELPLWPMEGLGRGFQFQLLQQLLPPRGYQFLLLLHHWL